MEAPGLHDPEAVAVERRCPEEWRRLVVAFPPGNPQCPMQLLRPSLSTLRLRLQCTQHQHTLWKFCCGKTCALWLVSDVGLRKVLYSVPFREIWFVTGVHTYYFTVCEERVFSAEHQIWAILVSSCPQKRPFDGDRRAFEGAAALPELFDLTSRDASCGCRKREDDLASLTGATPCEPASWCIHASGLDREGVGFTLPSLAVKSVQDRAPTS